MCFGLKFHFGKYTQYSNVKNFCDMSHGNECESKNSENKKLTINITKCYKKHPPQSTEYTWDQRSHLQSVVSKEKPTSFEYKPHKTVYHNNETLQEQMNNERRPITVRDTENINHVKAKPGSLLERLTVEPKQTFQDDKKVTSVKSPYFSQGSSSQAETKQLPSLSPRYHGPNCAMEINVLEKHEQTCRYRKKMNPERNLTEDQVGSYETIGRIIFNTCEDYKRDETLEEIRRSPNVTFVSILNSLTRKISGYANDTELRKSHSDILPEIIKNQQVLDKLVKSSKSFTLGEAKNIKCDKCDPCSCTDCSCDVIEELFVHCSKVNTQTQTEKLKKSNIKNLFRTILLYVAKKLRKFKF